MRPNRQLTTATLLILVSTVACKRPPVVVPPESDVVYDAEKRLVFNSAQRQFTEEFKGTKQFDFGSDGCKQVQFSFDNNSPAGFRDTMMLSVYDESGLLPGETFTYYLTKRARGSFKNWQIVLSNPLSATTRKREFQFVFALGGSLPDIEWDTVVPDALGSYSFGTTDRTMTITMTFNVKSHVSGKVNGSCGAAE